MMLNTEKGKYVSELLVVVKKMIFYDNFKAFEVIIFRKRLFHRKFRLPKFENCGLRNRKHPLTVPLL